MPPWVGTSSAVLDDAVDVLLAFAGGVGVIQTQVELAAVLVGNGPVDVDGLGTADVQIAVGLGREAGYGSRGSLPSARSASMISVRKFFISHEVSPCQGSSVPSSHIWYIIHHFRDFFKRKHQKGAFCRHFWQLWPHPLTVSVKESIFSAWCTVNFASFHIGGTP